MLSHQGRAAAGRAGGAHTVDVRRGLGARRARFDFSADGVRRSLEDSLARLGLDRVDVVHVHDPDDHLDEAIAPALPGARRAARRGRDRRGRRRHEPRRRRCARFVREADVDCILLAGRYTLLDQQRARRAAAAVPRARASSVIAGGVLNSGILADPRDGRRSTTSPRRAALLERARAIAAVCERHGVPLPVAATAFPLRHPAVACVLVGARSPREVAADIEGVRHPIPGALWTDLVSAGLLPEQAGGVIVDAHHHLWDPARRDYPWMTGDADALRRPFGLGDLRAAVEPPASARPSPSRRRRPRRRPRSCSRSPPSPTASSRGVVGWIDLTAPDVARAARRAARRPPAASASSASATRSTTSPTPPGCDRDDVAPRAARRRTGRPAPTTCCCSPQHLPPRRASPPRCPSSRSWSTMAPSRRIAAGEREPWSSRPRRARRARARHCKLSGLVTEADWLHWREHGRRRLRAAAARAVRPRAADVRLRLARLHARRLLRRGPRRSPAPRSRS